ncbi:MAG: hypothetical protein K6F77_00255 [Lachnospiraceae bacterium]|nr:hypothetical protein [Lachnospiraceae bacterium]
MNNQYQGGNGKYPNGGQNPYNRQMPNGQMPNGQMPNGGQNPYNRQMPNGGQNPYQGQMPNGGQNPYQGQMPNGGPNPYNRQMPNGGQNPYNRQMPNGGPQKKPKKAGKVVLGIIIGIVVLFIIFMLIPTDSETGNDGKTKNEADVSNSGENGKNGNKKKQDVDIIDVDSDAKSATVMIYMNGSDLESKAGQASMDISEMLASGIGENVNVIIQTMGTKKWHDYGISSKTSQRYQVVNGELELIQDNLGQLDCTAKDTLSDYIGFCKNNFPADRYYFVFWNHGGGPVYGFGYDQWQDENSSLTINEMAKAFEENNDVHFEIIGMDCCIMASLETCYALAPYCKYTLLSEDFESGLGWSYKRWMKKLERNPGISAPILGKCIIDDVIKTNENSEYGDSVCMGLYNESTIYNLFDAWTEYAYKNENQLSEYNYSRVHRAKGRGFFDNLVDSIFDIWSEDESDVTISDYYITDMLALVEETDKDSDEAKNLTSTLKACVAYYGHSSDTNELTGLAVSIPYGDRKFYNQLKRVYKQIDIEDNYIKWLGGFVSGSNSDDYYNYDEFEEEWNGWADYEEEYGSNASNGETGEYAYDYDEGDYFGYEDESSDDWVYDYQEELWYLYEDDVLYLYDEETDTLFYYDEYYDEIYYYDEKEDDWFLFE